MPKTTDLQDSAGTHICAGGGVTKYRTIVADESWADTLPPCVECGHDVPWDQALLMPCSHVEDGDVDTVGIVHRDGCPLSPPTGRRK